MISEEAGRAMSVISGIDFYKQVEPGFWMGCVTRIVLDLDEAGHQDRVREIGETIYRLWQVLPDKAGMIRCNRCEVLPGTVPARSICGDCDDVLLCLPCYERHAREVFDQGRESDTALTGEALLRFEAAAEVVTRVAVRDMALRGGPSVPGFGHGVDLARPADRGPLDGLSRRLYGGHARAEPRPGMAGPGGGDPPPGAGAEAEGA
jgi:hypothetical protein